jgi:hypothetical protein
LLISTSSPPPLPSEPSIFTFHRHPHPSTLSCVTTLWTFTTYTVKKVSGFPVPSRYILPIFSSSTPLLRHYFRPSFSSITYPFLLYYLSVPPLLPLSLLFCLCPSSIASVPPLLPLSLLYCLCPYSIASVPTLLPLSLLYCPCPSSIASVPTLLPLSLLYCLCPSSISSVPPILPLSLLYCLCPSSVSSVPPLFPLSLLYCLCPSSITSVLPSCVPSPHSFKKSAPLLFSSKHLFGNKLYSKL